LIDAAISAFLAALATEGLWVLVVAVAVAGLVRGFAGFGTAMIFMPFASNVLEPVWAIITVLVFDLFGPLPNVPRALRDGNSRDVMRLGTGAVLGLPVGLFLLYRIDPDLFRWLVSGIALGLLFLLMSGWRHGGGATRRLALPVGAAGGFLGGISGLPGPPVILLYVSSRQGVAAIRANILLYLLVFDVLAFAMMAFSGRLDLVPVMIGLLLVVPYLVANVAGARLFDPERENVYRVVAYLLIATSALFNLPILG